MATRTATTKKVNQFYIKYAAEHIQLIDEDKHGLFCDVISESEELKTYRVHVDEKTLVPNPVHCTCTAFEYDPSRACKHIQVVALYYSRVYRSNVEKFEAKQAAKNAVRTDIVVERAKVYDKDLCTMIYLDTREIVDVEAYKAAIKAQNEAAGQVWDEVLQEWVSPPSDNPLNPERELSNWYAIRRQAKDRNKAQIRNQMQAIRDRSDDVKGDLNGNGSRKFSVLR